MKKVRRMLLTAFCVLTLVGLAVFVVACNDNFFRVTAEFDATRGTVILSSPAREEGYAAGESVRATAVAKPGYALDELTVNGEFVPVENSVATFTVEKDTTVKATFIDPKEIPDLGFAFAREWQGSWSAADGSHSVRVLEHALRVDNVYVRTAEMKDSACSFRVSGEDYELRWADSEYAEGYLFDLCHTADGTHSYLSKVTVKEPEMAEDTLGNWYDDTQSNRIVVSARAIEINGKAVDALIVVERDELPPVYLLVADGKAYSLVYVPETVEAQAEYRLSEIGTDTSLRFTIEPVYSTISNKYESEYSDGTHTAVITNTGELVLDGVTYDGKRQSGVGPRRVSQTRYLIDIAGVPYTVLLNEPDQITIESASAGVTWVLKEVGYRFTITGKDGGPIEHGTITATESRGGGVVYAKGERVTFSFTPDQGYVPSYFSVDGVPQEIPEYEDWEEYDKWGNVTVKHYSDPVEYTYMIESLDADHTFAAEFALDRGSPLPSTTVSQEMTLTDLGGTHHMELKRLEAGEDGAEMAGLYLYALDDGPVTVRLLNGLGGINGFKFPKLYWDGGYWTMWTESTFGQKIYYLSSMSSSKEIWFLRDDATWGGRPALANGQYRASRNGVSEFLEVTSSSIIWRASDGTERTFQSLFTRRDAASLSNYWYVLIDGKLYEGIYDTNYVNMRCLSEYGAPYYDFRKSTEVPDTFAGTWEAVNGNGRKLTITSGKTSSVTDTANPAGIVIPDNAFDGDSLRVTISGKDWSISLGSSPRHLILSQGDETKIDFRKQEADPVTDYPIRMLGSYQLYDVDPVSDALLNGRPVVFRADGTVVGTDALGAKALEFFDWVLDEEQGDLILAAVVDGVVVYTMGDEAIGEGDQMRLVHSTKTYALVRAHDSASAALPSDAYGVYRTTGSTAATVVLSGAGVYCRSGGTSYYSKSVSGSGTSYTVQFSVAGSSTSTFQGTLTLQGAGANRGLSLIASGRISVTNARRIASQTDAGTFSLKRRGAFVSETLDYMVVEAEGVKLKLHNEEKFTAADSVSVTNATSYTAVFGERTLTLTFDDAKRELTVSCEGDGNEAYCFVANWTPAAGVLYSVTGAEEGSGCTYSVTVVDTETELQPGLSASKVAIGSTVTVSAAAGAGYTVTVRVGDVEVELTEGSYSFLALENVTVEIEFTKNA